MSLYDYSVKNLDGSPASLHDYEGKVLLIVNTASKCGLTPQYSALEALQQQYSSQGFSVLGFPCNQFGGQEPGTAEEIAEFCDINYKVTFPLFEKIEVNGDNQDPLYGDLTQVADAEGMAGDVKWNFEKFLIGRDGHVIERIRPQTTPDDPSVINKIEKALAKD